MKEVYEKNMDKKKIENCDENEWESDEEIEEKDGGKEEDKK